VAPTTWIGILSLMCETQRTFPDTLLIYHSELFHMSIIWRWRRMKQKRPTPTCPHARKIGQGSRAKAFVSDCALDGPSAADRQPSPGAEMIDRGNKSSQAVLNNCHLNQKTTSMYLSKVDSSPGSCSKSLHVMHLPFISTTCRQHDRF
jgi:hypothetical protein